MIRPGDIGQDPVVSLIRLRPALAGLVAMLLIAAGVLAAEPIRPLAQDFVVVYESPDPTGIYAYSPGLCRMPNGRLIATLDLGGPRVKDLPGPKGVRLGTHAQCKVFTSDNHGRTWTHRADLPIMHATPFLAGQVLYLLGHAGDLAVARSDNGGTAWSEAAKLTEGQVWTGHAHNAVCANGCVYIPMERYTRGRISWFELAPVLMRGRLGDDLTRRENWTFASELTFAEAVKPAELNYLGAPFYPGQLGWLEPNVVRLTDPDHVWCDPAGRTLHLWLRAHTNGSGYAAVVKVVEEGDRPGTGAMTTMLEKAPSGRTMVYVPCPGGQLKFNIQYDDKTKLFWLLSSQAIDGMVRRERMSPDRFNLPYDERHRLQLHFSRNCTDWCFAGLVCKTDNPRQARHYATMVIDGDDLHILSRSGDARAKSAHDGNIITFHTVHDFRHLVY